MMNYVRGLCVLVAAALAMTGDVHASFVSSTVQQSGFKIDTFTGRAAKVGSFSFAPTLDNVFAIRLDTWISMVPGLGDAPTLAFSKYQAVDDFTSFINPTTFQTSLQITQPVTPSFGVNQRDSGWVSLTAAQGASLVNLINSDPLGRVTVFLFSSNYKDFETPKSTTNFSFSPITGITITTINYNATLSLMTVPEPSSAMVFGGLAFAFLGNRVRRSLKRGKGVSKMGPTALKAILFLAMIFVPAQYGMCDVIYRGVAQQNGTVELTAGSRAVYLGRISDTAIPLSTAEFTGIYAGAVISGASNAELFLGNGSSNFETLRSSNLVFDTGLRFSNTNPLASDIESIFLPGFPPPTPGFGPPAPLSLATGTALRNQLLSVNYIDAWLVSGPSSTFTAPSFASPTNPNSFFLQVNAVPEPSSMVFAGLAAVGLLSGPIRRKIGKRFGRSSKV